MLWTYFRTVAGLRFRLGLELTTGIEGMLSSSSARIPQAARFGSSSFRIGASTSFEELKDFAQDGYDSPITLKPFKEGMRVGTDYEDRKVLASLSFDSFSHDHQFVTPGAALLWREYEDGLKALHFAADADELQLYLDELQGLEISDGEDEEDD